MKPVFDEGGIRLYQGDARAVLEDERLDPVDLLLSDPPYGMGYRSTLGVTIAGDGKREALPLLERVLELSVPQMVADAHAYLFCHWASWPGFFETARHHFDLKTALIWWKQRGGMGDTKCSYAPDYEVILHGIRGRRPLSGGRDGAVLDSFPPPPPGGRHHPTEKPLGLLRYLITKSATRDGLIFDPFAGSGSTLVAAVELGRRAVGIELNDAYCAVAARRIAAALDRRARIEKDQLVADDPAMLRLTKRGRGYRGAATGLDTWFVVESFGSRWTRGRARSKLDVFRPVLAGETIAEGAFVHCVERDVAGDATSSTIGMWPEVQGQVEHIRCATLLEAR